MCTGREEYEKLRGIFDRQLPKECGNCDAVEGLHIHHIVPLSFGGSNRLSNLVRLCTGCHSKAHGGVSFIESSIESRRKRAKKGRHAAGAVPYGYILDGEGKYAIDEDTAKVVRLIFRLRYSAELSTINIANYLNHMAIPTARKAPKWAHPTIAKMLKNPQYLGKVYFVGEYLGEGIFPAIIRGEDAENIVRFETKYKGRRLSPKKLHLTTKGGR